MGIYEVHWGLVDSASRGLPQQRERVYIVGMRAGANSFPSQGAGALPGAEDDEEDDDDEERKKGKKRITE